ncbi:hypothetical protein [Eleftheria terrae]|uniref:hypothetical protein n=1 Tax=Eleftheria terrae TaxID=1597781 RepID=UPI00263A934C|nr:hypothetical protein [Eleftheria terrae]WKB53618.1 hypothetical protein N7L95_04265 [Eleftheria terrae]
MAGTGAATIVLIRHAEKPLPGCGGVDDNGREDAHALSVPGWQRAGALVRFFAGPAAGSGLPAPASLFAAAHSARRPSRRPALTLAPLARRLQLPVCLDCASEDPPEQTAARLLAAPGPVLVCWRHRELPPLARALLGGQCQVPEWPEDRFDITWLLTPGMHPPALRQLPQRLLAGDGDACLA